jgi:hypothetical protein
VHADALMTLLLTHFTNAQKLTASLNAIHTSSRHYTLLSQCSRVWAGQPWSKLVIVTITNTELYAFVAFCLLQAASARA